MQRLIGRCNSHVLEVSETEKSWVVFVRQQVGSEESILEISEGIPGRIFERILAENLLEIRRRFSNGIIKIFLERIRNKCLQNFLNAHLDEFPTKSLEDFLKENSMEGFLK